MAKSKSISEMFSQIYSRNRKVPIVEDVPMGVMSSQNVKVAGTLNRVARREEDDYIQVLAKRVR